ncbi:archaetidylserine decarboxylase [Sorangium sp. So ce426]|uniref:archaetidylserine decarboxylase n=1 Tax=Sorangium sp. So ce426 TaxID=3133312 RepID=UPI003F5C974B
MTVATYAAAQLLRVLPRERITRAVGRLCDARAPAAVLNTVVKLYARAYRVDMDAAEVLTSPYESFDAFFTRKLREGMRPVCSDPGAITSPADGRVEALGPVTEGGRLTIKGQPYRVEDLVGDPAEATRYDGGQFAIVYLSPRDYHRVHSPVAGRVSLIRSMPGELFPVNAIGERHVPGLFARNRRVAIVIDTERQGRVTVVMVGAMIVGRITVSAVDARDVPLGVHTISPALPVACGEEIGKFHLGSTAVMFVERGVAPPWSRAPGPILYGEPLDGGGQR